MGGLLVGVLVLFVNKQEQFLFKKKNICSISTKMKRKPVTGLHIHQRIEAMNREREKTRRRTLMAAILNPTKCSVKLQQGATGLINFDTF